MSTKRKIVEIQDVLDWVDAKFVKSSACVQKLRTALREQEYNGSSLPALGNTERLEQLGVDKMGVQDEIVLAVQTLKSGADPYRELPDWPASAAAANAYGGGGVGGGPSGGGGGSLGAAKLLSPYEEGSLPSGFAEDVGRAVISICQNRFTFVADTIELLDGVKWPLATNSSLYVRRCYEPLYSGVLDRCQRQAIEQSHFYVLTGQPGIGKSVFGWYVIFKLLNDEIHKDKTIVYFHKDLRKNAVIIDRKNGIVRVARRENMGIDVNNTIVISDTVPPERLDCPSLWIISPGSLQKDKVKEYRNRFSTAWLYMPLSTERELLDMRDKIFRNQPLTEQAVRDRIALWGPVVRHVFYRYYFTEQRAWWNKIKDMTPQEIEKSFACVKRSAGDGRNPHHALFLERAHGQDVKGIDLDSPDYYQRGKPIIASATVAQWLIAAMKIHKELQKADFIMWPAGVGEDGAKRGTIFEELSLKVLQRGGQFTVRALGQAGNKETWNIKEMKYVKWPKGGNLKARAQPNTIIVPAKGNEAGLDTLMWLDEMSHHVPVDFTVSEEHGIHQVGLFKNLSVLGWKEESGWDMGRTDVPYIWVVPEDRFDSWTRPQAAKSGTSHAAGKHLKQYVLRMQFDMLFEIYEGKGSNRAAGAADSEKSAPEQLLDVIKSSSPIREDRKQAQAGKGSDDKAEVKGMASADIELSTTEQSSKKQGVSEIGKAVLPSETMVDGLESDSDSDRDSYVQDDLEAGSGGGDGGSKGGKSATQSGCESKGELWAKPGNNAQHAEMSLEHNFAEVLHNHTSMESPLVNNELVLDS